MPNRGRSQKRWDEAVAATACLFCGVLGACSSEGNILPKRERFTPTLVDSGGVGDAEPDVASVPDVASDGYKPRDPNANCVKPGTPSNERGVGGYCEAGPVDCIYEAGPRFCTADFKEVASVPDDAWFCTTTCTIDDECGSGAVCQTSGVGNGCVPLVCIMDGSSTHAGR